MWVGAEGGEKGGVVTEASWRTFCSSRHEEQFELLLWAEKRDSSETKYVVRDKVLRRISNSCLDFSSLIYGSYIA